MEAGDSDELPVRRDQETIDLADFIDEDNIITTAEDGTETIEDGNQLGTLNSRMCSSQGIQKILMGDVRDYNNNKWNMPLTISTAYFSSKCYPRH
jgi:hypothetical protein